MTDLNTQMTPEAMMQAEIERSARDYNDLRDAFDKVVAERNWADHRAEKAERELAEHCAHTDALIAAARAIEAHDAFEPAYLSADLNDKLADLSEALRAYRDSNQAEGAR
ncbi:hypothetical protein [Paenirhodobacter populi]|uniref:Uncharacterized protein n=1 Tax=Paenirhodobacter populi TaxID=2306993 RepID=A0A443JE29_9RHOB|nr:hypothetical protein [Sinirhodobacter populi]RWR18829.1 hypothetical protein D2T30_15840 [Sinirhodobacter populi]